MDTDTCDAHIEYAHTHKQYTHINTLSLVFYEYSTCAYMDAIPCATLFQGFNIYPLVFRRVLC